LSLAGAHLLATLLCWTCMAGLHAQQDYPYAVERYPFLHLDKNQLTLPGSPDALAKLFAKFDQILFQGMGQAHIVQIGGSHIQADMWSDRMRQRLQHFFPGTEATRGLLFPYSMARTNNPYNFLPEYTGLWEACRSVQWNRTCDLGPRASLRRRATVSAASRSASGGQVIRSMSLTAYGCFMTSTARPTVCG
jgi:hypothetical protein